MITHIKSLLITLSIMGISGCARTTESTPSFITLGSPASSRNWVYVSGLSQDVDAEKYTNHQSLNRIGTALNITFLAITPQHRCPSLGNKLCWPSDTPEQIFQTYQEIQKALDGKTIEGFIGFSNGSFFLNRLAQLIELNHPIITIGAAGPRISQGKKNSLYIMIGKNDLFHYDHAKKFHNDIQHSLVNAKLIEYDGGHEIPELLLETLLNSLVSPAAIKENV